MINLEHYGFDPSMQPEGSQGIPARITATYRNRFELVSNFGTGTATLKKSVYFHGDEMFPTTGDFVLLEQGKHGENQILKTLPRSTCFTRLDPSASGHGCQTVAANFDDVFILQSLESDVNLPRLERYLTLAWQSGAVPTVILTKADLIDDATAQLHAVRQLGVEVFALSCVTGEGMAALNGFLRSGRTVALLGMSGAGKSSLVNALSGDDFMKTGSVRNKDNRGRHTTSHRQLILLKSGVILIDTPGMRELGMWDADEGLDKSFSDVSQYFGQCKFRDCQHQSEPGCAVKDAMLHGELSQSRWDSYLHLQAESAVTKRSRHKTRKALSKQITQTQRNKEIADYRTTPCEEHFTCIVCGTQVSPEHAGSQHRNHCLRCLSSVHVDNKPGDRASLCRGTMDPIGVWVRKNGEWAIIHRCRACGILSSNRIAADDNATLLMSLAVKPLASPPFPLWEMDK